MAPENPCSRRRSPMNLLRLRCRTGHCPAKLPGKIFGKFRTELPFFFGHVNPSSYQTGILADAFC